MQEEYDYFYRVTSDAVHFNPRIALRNGWGESGDGGTFSSNNFARYYLGFCQTYSVMLFAMIAEAFAIDLSLTDDFKVKLTDLKKNRYMQLRWPEAVTFWGDEPKPPNPILAVAARVMWEDPEGRQQLELAAKNWAAVTPIASTQAVKTSNSKP